MNSEGNGLYIFTVASEVSGGQWDTPAIPNMEDHLQALIRETFAFAAQNGSNPLQNLGTNDGGVTVFVQFNEDLSSADQTTLAGLVQRASEYFIVSTDGGSTDVGEGAAISNPAGPSSATTITLQCKNGDGSNSNGHGETVTLTPVGLMPASTLGGVTGGNGKFSFTIGSSLQKGTIPIAIAVGSMPVRNIVAIWT